MPPTLNCLKKNSRVLEHKTGERHLLMSIKMASLSFIATTLENVVII